MPQIKNFEISIIIPNYNGEMSIKKNLPFTINALENKRNHIKEIIVVDDASTDDSIGLLKSQYKNIRLIKHTQRRGLLVAANTGVRASRGQLIALINPGVRVDAGFLEKMGNRFNDDSVFAVALHEKGEGRLIGKFKDGFIDIKFEQEEDTSHLCFLAGRGSGVFNKRIWTELGGLDDKLFSPLYWEDLDICFRAYKRGYKVIWDPSSNIDSGGEPITGNLSENFLNNIKESNLLLLIWKNITSPVLFRKHLVFLIRRMLRHPGYIKVVFKALSKLKIVIAKRRKEIKDSRLSDEAVFSKFNSS